MPPTDSPQSSLRRKSPNYLNFHQNNGLERPRGKNGTHHLKLLGIFNNFQVLKYEHNCRVLLLKYHLDIFFSLTFTFSDASILSILKTEYFWNLFGVFNYFYHYAHPKHWSPTQANNFSLLVYLFLLLSKRYNEILVDYNKYLLVVCLYLICTL